MDDCILTERLLLRRPRASDDTAYFAIHGDPRTARFRRLGPDASIDIGRATLARWIAHWEEHGFGPWTLEARAREGDVIGFAGLRLRGEGEVPGLNLYFRLRPEAWGHGYATEVARAAVRCAFDQGIADEVTALTKAENAPAIGVLERIGMQYVRDVDLRGEPMRLYAIRR